MDVIIVGIILLVCAVFDLKFRKIPNYITVPFLVVGIIYTFINFGIKGVGNSLLNVLIVILIFFYGFIKSYMGAGDIKVLLALAFWLDTVNMILFIFMTLIVGAVISVYKMVVNVKAEHKKQCIRIDEINPVYVVNRLKMKNGKTIAYAVPIFVGYFLMVFMR